MINHFFTLLLAASCLTAFGQVPDHWPADGLIYWFDFESDDSSLGFDYTITSGTVNAAEDRYGLVGAAQFANDADVLIATGDSPAPSSTFSYSFWFFTSPGSPTTTALHPIHGQTFGNEDDHSGSGVFIGSNELAIIEHSGDYVREAIRVDMDLSGWHHVVVNYVNNEATIYIDGEQRGQSVSDERLVHPPLGADSSSPYSSYGIGKGFGTAGYDVTVQWTGRRFVGRLDDFGVWERALLQEEVVTLFNASSPIGGCIDTMACNFNPDAEVDDGSCHFLCQYCKEGTIWDEAIQGCVVANPADINFDGCVQLNDLLDLLSAYGDCGAEESPWQCGDPLEYQGYDYETVQIGEQCWFAENLRANNYRNGDAITIPQDSETWAATIEGAVTVYGDYPSSCSDYLPNGDGCDASANLIDLGRLYNWYATIDERNICPFGWDIPSQLEFTALINLSLELGAGSSASNLKSESGWYANANGSNSLGFGGQPGGYATSNGSYHNIGRGGYWWAFSGNAAVNGKAWAPFISWNEGVNSTEHTITEGFSVRCIQNAE